MTAFQFPDPSVTQTVKNPITGSTYQWQEDPGKWVVTVSIREVGDIIWEGDLPPDPIGDYKLWYNTDELELNFYYCDANGVCAWVPTSVPIQVLEDLNVFAAQAEVDINQLQYKQTLQQNLLDELYLAHQQDSYVKKKGGDSMEGPLTIQAQDPTDARATKRVDTLGVFSNSEGSALRLGTTRDRIYVGHDDVSINGPVKVGEIQEKSNGNGIKVSNDLTMSDNKLTGLPEAVDDSDAVPLVQLLDNVSILQNEIVELEQEIDAIAPAADRGTWKFTLSAELNIGTYALSRNNFVDGLNQMTSAFEVAKCIIIQETDQTGKTHAFGDIEAGMLLEIFEEGAADFGLYAVEGINPFLTLTNRLQAYAIDVSLINTGQNDSADDVARFKFFHPPTGGDADGYVLKSGDTMEGKLTFKNNLDVTETNSTNVPSRLTFKNVKSDNTEQVINLWQAGAQSSLITNAAFKSKAGTYTGNYYYGWDGDSTTYLPRIHMTSGAMHLKYSSTTRISIGSGDVNYYGDHIFGNDNTRIYIRSAANGSSNSYGTSGQALFSNGNKPPYWGSVLTSQTQANWNTTDSNSKAYINNKPTVVTGSKAGIKISSSNGNYYIEG